MKSAHRLRHLAMTLAALQGVAYGDAFAQAASESPLPPAGALERRFAPARFVLREIVIEGATVLDPAEVRDLIAPFIGQSAGGTELREIVRLVDALYESKGYIGSTARLDDQPIVDGTVRLRMREARLAKVEIGAGNFWNRKQFIAWSASPPFARPLHLPTLQERLANLREGGLFEKIDADLRLPSPADEGATLKIDVVEALPFSIAASVANNRPPSVGSVRSEIAAADRSLTGWGDTLAMRFGRTRGIDDSDIGYTFPIPATPVSVFARRVRSDSRAIDPPLFRDLQIVAVTDTDAAGATVSIYKSERAAMTAGFSRERRKTVSSLLGIPFSFTPGLPDAPSTFQVVRGSVEGGWKVRQATLTGRVGYSAGKISEVLETDVEDALRARFHFVQAAFGAVRPFGHWGELRVRLEGQYSRQRLPPIERLSIGGSTTVRGYRENLALRDSGAFGSIEWRLPERQPLRWLKVGSAFFVDAGWGRNATGSSDSLPSTIASVGLAVDATVLDHARLSVAYAVPSKRNLTPRDDLQDRGIHLAFSVFFP